MFGFIKKLFGFGSADQTVNTTAQAPYKVEGPLGVPAPVNPQITDAVTQTPAVKLRQPGTPKQGQRKPAGKKPQGAKPAGQKPATQKKPAQPKPQGGQKPAGNKPRGRRPKAKPAAPQQ